MSITAVFTEGMALVPEQRKDKRMGRRQKERDQLPWRLHPKQRDVFSATWIVDR